MDRPVALVTGASSGIGAAFTRALAGRDHDLVVVARGEDGLRAIAAEVEAASGAATEVLVADLASPPGVARVEARLRDADRPVELLVNNAGFGTSGRLWELPVEREDEEVRLNVLALVRLTHAALGPMVERGRGGVVNVSSVAGYQPIPRSATYAATKAFVSSFTNSVHEELRGTGVRAMVVAPGYTRTKFQDVAGMEGATSVPGFMWMSAEDVVDAALKAYDRGRAVCVPGALNAVTAALSGSMPAGVGRRAAGIVSKRAY